MTERPTVDLAGDDGHGPRCPRCGGFIRFEPGRFVCTSCSREWRRLTTTAEFSLQLKIDGQLRCRSAESRATSPLSWGPGAEAEREDAERRRRRRSEQDGD